MTGKRMGGRRRLPSDCIPSVLLPVGVRTLVLTVVEHREPTGLIPL